MAILEAMAGIESEVSMTSDSIRAVVSSSAAIDIEASSVTTGTILSGTVSSGTVSSGTVSSGTVTSATTTTELAVTFSELSSLASVQQQCALLRQSKLELPVLHTVVSLLQLLSLVAFHLIYQSSLC